MYQNCIFNALNEIVGHRGRVSYVYWFRPVPYPSLLLADQRGGGGGGMAPCVPLATPVPLSFFALFILISSHPTKRETFHYPYKTFEGGQHFSGDFPQESVYLAFSSDSLLISIFLMVLGNWHFILTMIVQNLQHVKS